MRRQGARAVPRRGRSGPVRGQGQARAVGACFASQADPQSPCDRGVIQITDAAREPLYLQAALSIGLVRPARFRASVILEGSMVIRTIAYASAFAGTVAIGLAAPASSQTRAPAREEARYAPIQSISYDFGSKSMSGYF